jgi:dolichyl-phosphate beta-glucosyltransferase
MQSTARPEEDSTPIELSVLVPAYNAAAFLAANLSRMVDFLRHRTYTSEIIVIDDGSTDGTGRIAESLASAVSAPAIVVLHSARNEGKGSAVVQGLRRARGRCAVLLDADLEYPPDQIERLMTALRQGADIAIGNRQLPESRLALHRADLPQYFLRYVISRTLNLAVRALLLPGLQDTQAGLKGLRVSACRPLTDRLRCRGFGVDIELLLLARERGLKIVEVPARVESRGGHSTIRIVGDSTILVRDLGLIMLRFLLGTVGELTGWRGHMGLTLSTGTTRLAVAAVGSATVILACLLMGHYHLADAGRDAMAAWLGALAGTVLLGIAIDGGWHAARRPRFRSRAEVLLFVLLIATVAVLRLYRLDTIPAMMHGDSAECGNLGRDILSGVNDLFDFSPWYNTPFISFVPYAVSFASFGLSVFSLRLPSALMGIAAAVPLYFLARAWFGTRVAQLATFLFAFSHPLIHFSRIGLWNIQVVFYQLLAFAFVVGALHRRSAVLAVLGGIAAGVGLFSYTAARIIPVICLTGIGYELLRARGSLRLPILRAGILYSLALLITALPLALNYVKHPDVLKLDRTSDVSVLAPLNRPHVESVYGVNGTWAILREQTARTLKGFVSLGDGSSQYGTPQPILSPFSLPFFLAGIGLAIWRIRQARYFFTLAWLTMILFFGSVLVIDPPSYTRLVGAFPAVCLLMAIGLDGLLRLLDRHRLLVRRDAAALCALVLLQAAAFNVVGYYNYLRRMDVMPREWDVLKVIAATGVKVDYYLFTGPFLYADAPVFRLFARGTRTITGFSETDIPSRLTRDTVFILTPEFRDLGLAIQERLPGADLQVYPAAGRAQVYVYSCTAANACRRGTA